MKYWAYINNEILGPFEREKLLEVPMFSNSTLICPQAPVGEKTEDWKEAATFPEISALLSGAGEVKLKDQMPGDAPAHSLKPISLNDISKGPQAGEPPLAAPNIEINKLHSASEKKSEPVKEEVKEAPVSNSSEKFDPISISEIGRKNPNLETHETKFASTMDPMSLSQISRKQQDYSSQSSASNINEIGSISNRQADAAPVNPPEHPPVINIPVQNEDPVKEAPPPLDAPGGNIVISDKSEPLPASSPAPVSSGGAPTPAGDEIMRLIEKLASDSATKSDINDLKNYLDSKMDDVNRKIANITVSNIDSSIKNIDGRLSKIEDKISNLQFSQPAAKTESSFDAGPGMSGGTFTLDSVQQKVVNAPEKKESAAPVSDQQKPAEEKKKFSLNMGKIFKPVFKVAVILLLLAGVAGITVFALKQAGIMDLTGYIAKFAPLPFLTQGQPEASQTVQEEPGSQTGVDVSTQTAAQEKAPEPPKDLSEEVVYFSRTYALNSQGLSLENAILTIAKKRRANVNGIAWQAKMGENQVYQVNCSVPLKKGKMDFSFEADYNVKTLKPLNASGKAALDSLAAAPAPVPLKKGSKGKKAAVKKEAPKKEARKKEEAKPAEDEEYVYEYVDEDEADNQEEYVMPGVPKK